LYSFESEALAKTCWTLCSIWVQGVLIAGLAWFKIIKPRPYTTYDTAADLSGGLQDFLICIEMFVAALAHAWAFPPRDYMDPNVRMPAQPPNFTDLNNCIDVCGRAGIRVGLPARGISRISA
jgi:hypothetical protein